MGNALDNQSTDALLNLSKKRTVNLVSDLDPLHSLFSLDTSNDLLI